MIEDHSKRPGHSRLACLHAEGKHYLSMCGKCWSFVSVHFFQDRRCECISCSL